MRMCLLCAGSEVEFAVKAVDTGYNTQPESPRAIWNKRGILNNAWHRVKVTVDPEA